MDKWGFCYVENLTWVQMAPNNTVVAAPSVYARRSHLSLFIFRKSGASQAKQSKLCTSPAIPLAVMSKLLGCPPVVSTVLLQC